ncbi:MAG: VIT domain-containing protein [Chloroflexi bacterium]|nr:VIT domain-containing protein [Chloroflexota bacterium]
MNPVTPSPHHPVTLSPCHPVTLSPCHPVTVSPCHPVTVSPCHRVTVSPCHPVTVSPCHPVTLSPRHLVAALLILLASLLLTAQPAAADGIIIPRPPPDRPTMPWRDIPLTVKYHRVNVTIQDQVATTKVDQVFVNDARFAIEGTYMFPLPEDAAISSFDMWVDGQKVEGKLLGREEARGIYEEIVRSQRDPALLEYVGRGAFQASIFPIPPGAERRIELTYAQVLPQTAGLVHYRYPLNTEKFSARPLSEVAVTVRIEDKNPLRVIYSSSHPVAITRDGDRRATASYEARNVRPDRDFDLYYSVSTDAIAANLLTYKPFDEDGFFLLLVTPPVRAESAVIAKDVILVFDVSGSMDGEKLTQAKAAARYVLDHLGETDRFNIVAFSSATRLFADRPVGLNRRAEGLDFVNKLTAQGSTDINRALLEALAGADKERPTVLIFLTDGLPTMGEINPDRIAANVAANAAKSVRLFAFGVGNEVDTVLLDQLSSGQRGTSAYVKPGQKIDEEVSGFYAKVSAPVLVDVSLEVSGVRVEDLYPYPLPDLFAGNQLIVAGRYRGSGPATIKLTGKVNGQPQTTTYADLTFVARGGDEFIPRLWAQRKIGYLLAQIRLKGTKDELVKEVISLSTRYGIVTPYTSFLVQEPQLALTQGGRDQLTQGSGAAPAPTAAPGRGGAPVTPAPAPMAPGARAGEQAVQRAEAEKALSSSDQAAAPAPGKAADQVKQVGDKTFLLVNGVWQDTAFDASRSQAESVAFGSERYFQLLAQTPEIGRYLALGDRVTLLVAGRAYAISPDGKVSAPAPAPQPTAAPPAATRQPGASPAPTTAAATSTAVRPATLVAPIAPTPIPVATQPAPASGASPLCPGAAAAGIIGLILPLAVRRRGR